MATEEEDKGGGEGSEPSSACQSCGSANEDNSKFCDQCGASMAAPQKDPDGDGDDDAEDAAPPPPPEGDPEKKTPPAPAAPPPKANQPPPPERTRQAALATTSIAGMLGLPETASAVAIKSELAPLLTLRDSAMRITATRSPREATGALASLAAEAALAPQLRANLNAEVRKREWSERMSLLNKAAAATSPGEWFVFDVNETTGKKTKRPKPIYATCDLETLRGEVNARLKTSSANPQRGTPFQPDPKAVEAAASGAHITEHDREVAARHGFDPKDVAASRVALMNQNRAHGARSGV